MDRLLFEKSGNGIWISHLDLMRVFQRAFRRAGLSLRHTEGYNPHAFVSILLPLSVGASSVCELLEFSLNDGDVPALEALPERLNGALPDGIVCRTAYPAQRKVRELTHLRARVTLEYDAGVPTGGEEAVAALLNGETLVVEKRSKKGVIDLDIRPMLQQVQVRRTHEHVVELEAVVCAQNPSLNPALLAAAVTRHLPSLMPDFSSTCRLELLDAQGQIFR